MDCMISCIVGCVLIISFALPDIYSTDDGNDKEYHNNDHTAECGADTTCGSIVAAVKEWKSNDNANDKHSCYQ